MTKNYKLYTDSSFNKNNSKIGCVGGYIQNPQGKIIDSWSELLTNGNFAEHELRGTLLGLQKLVQHGIKNVDCYTDNQGNSVMLNTDLSKNKNTFRSKNLKAIEPLLKQFEQIEFHYIPREENERADYYSRQAYKTLSPLELKKIQDECQNTINRTWNKVGRLQEKNFSSIIDSVSEKTFVNLLLGRENFISTAYFIPKSKKSDKELSYFMKIKSQINDNLNPQEMQIIENNDLSLYCYQYNEKEVQNIKNFLESSKEEFLKNFDIILIKEPVAQEIIFDVALEKISNHIHDSQGIAQVSTASALLLTNIIPENKNSKHLFHAYQTPKERHFAMKLLDASCEQICLFPHEKLVNFINKLHHKIVPRREDLFTKENLPESLAILIKESNPPKLQLFHESLEFFNKTNQLPLHGQIRSFIKNNDLDLDYHSSQTIKDKILGEIMKMEIQELKTATPANFKEAIAEKVKSLQEKFGYEKPKMKPN